MNVDDRSKMLRDFAIPLVIVLMCWLVADVRESFPRNATWLKANRRYDLGSEYNSIAKAMRSGRGYSDPFREQTGPTAWMPPVLSSLLVVAYWASADNVEIVADIAILFQSVSAFLAGWLAFKQSKKYGLATVGIITLSLGFISNFYQLFQTTTDVGLLLLVVSIWWLGAVAFWDCPRKIRYAVLWGAFGGISALCSPVIGTGWAILVAIRWFPLIPRLFRGDPSELRRAIQVSIAAVVSMGIVMPWTIRNYSVFGQTVPIKSNMMYELYLSQCLSVDGLLDSKVIVQHPWLVDGEQRQQYKSQGEINFIRSKGQLAIKSIAANPRDFLRRIVNRFVAACLYYQPFSSAELEFCWSIRFVRCLHFLPFLALVSILIFRSHLLAPQVGAAIAIYTLMITPYILISYYDRYAAPLVGIKMLLVIYGIESLQTFLASCSGRFIDTVPYLRKAAP